MQRFHDPLKPLLDFVRPLGPFSERLTRIVKELPEKHRKALQSLGKEGWFCDPEMSLDFLSDIDHLLMEDPNKVSEELQDFFRERLNDIEQDLVGAYPHRKHLLNHAFEAHREGKYSLSIQAFLSQADGVFWEKSSKRKSLFIDGQRKDATKEHRSRTSDFNAIILYPLEISLPLWKPKGKGQSFSQLNRHAVLHGLSVEYDTEENSLKAISLLNYLHWVLSKSEEEETVSS